MLYNANFKMRDFFMNNKLVSVFPQFNDSDNVRDVLDEDKMYKKACDYLSKALCGTVDGDNIIVDKSIVANVAAQVNALKYILEGFYDNIQSIVSNIKSNSKLYTSVASVEQLMCLISGKDKLKFFNEVQENINYNPEFNSLNTVRSYSPQPYFKRQQDWKRKVGYKEKNR